MTRRLADLRRKVKTRGGGGGGSALPSGGCAAGSGTRCRRYALRRYVSMSSGASATRPPPVWVSFTTNTRSKHSQAEGGTPSSPVPALEGKALASNVEVRAQQVGRQAAHQRRIAPNGGALLLPGLTDLIPDRVDLLLEVDGREMVPAGQQAQRRRQHGAHPLEDVRPLQLQQQHAVWRGREPGV